MNEVRNRLFCTIDDSNKCVRINQVADCGNEYRETITAMTVEFTSDNFVRASEQLNFDEPLPVNIEKDRLQQEVSKLVIAHYGNEYQWMKDDCFDVMPDTEIWHIGRRLSCLILMFFASLTTFALTETIDGVAWNYYIENDHAVLECPNLRKSSFAQPAYSGTLPSEVSIPSSLGGYPVSIIGQFSLWLGRYDRVPYVGLVVIPETVTGIGDMAFIGGFLHNPDSQHNYYGWAHVGYLQPVPNILFLGPPPTTANLSHSWMYKNGTSLATDQWARNDFGTYYQNGQRTGEYAFYQKSQFYGCNCYVVEGVEGWIEGSDYFNGVVKYGAAKIEIAPIEKVFTGVASVSLSCTNRMAKIYYTLDGSDPTTNQATNCFLYEGPFAISHRTQVKALAYVSAYPYQVVYSNEYALGQTVAPNISAHDNVFNWSGNVVTLSCMTEGAEIRYTLDGSEPTEESALYTGPFAIDDTTTVKAKAFKEDWFESETATAIITREWYTVETPVITPGDTTFANASQEIGISCETEGATILYTTDGSDPVEYGREYKRPFKVYNTCTVRAVAVKFDWKNSGEATVTMTRGEPLSEAVNLYGYKMGTDTDKHGLWTRQCHMMAFHQFVVTATDHMCRLQLTARVHFPSGGGQCAKNQDMNGMTMARL